MNAHTKPTTITAAFSTAAICEALIELGFFSTQVVTSPLGTEGVLTTTGPIEFGTVLAAHPSSNAEALAYFNRHDQQPDGSWLYYNDPALSN